MSVISPRQRRKLYAEVDAMKEKIESKCRGNENVTKTSFDTFQRESNKAYSMDLHKRKGRALIIIMTPGREGWKADAHNLMRLFCSFDFDMDILLDCDYSELECELKDFFGSEQNKDVACAFVVVMAHGLGNYIRLNSDEHFEVLESFQTLLTYKNSPHLYKKPKIVIVQACRKNFQDVSPPMICSIRDDTTETVIGKNPSRGPSITDYMILHATDEGELAMRNVKDGSWFIQDLTGVFLSDAHNTAVEDMLAKVTEKVSKREDAGRPQINVNSMTLRKKFFIFPGYPYMK